jgi:hypothetical protein
MPSSNPPHTPSPNTKNNQYRLRLSQEELDALAAVLRVVDGASHGPYDYIKNVESRIMEYRNVNSGGHPEWSERVKEDSSVYLYAFPVVPPEEPPTVEL